MRTGQGFFNSFHLIIRKLTGCTAAFSTASKLAVHIEVSLIRSRLFLRAGKFTRNLSLLLVVPRPFLSYFELTLRFLHLELMT